MGVWGACWGQGKSLCCSGASGAHLCPERADEARSTYISMAGHMHLPWKGVCPPRSTTLSEQVKSTVAVEDCVYHGLKASVEG